MQIRIGLTAACAALALLGAVNVFAQSCFDTVGEYCQDNFLDFVSRNIIISDSGPTGEDLDRNVRIHCPDFGANPEPDEIPLVLLFHGGRGQPGGIRADVMAEEWADNNGPDYTHNLGEFLLVIPEGYDTNPTGPEDRQWNNRTDDLITPFPVRADDVKFIDELLDCMITEYDGTSPDAPWTIDASRIYAAGFSDGGAMVNRLAVEKTERFAAVASVSGRLAYVYDDAYDSGVEETLFMPSRFLPYMMIHGDGEPGSPGACPPMITAEWDGWFAPYGSCHSFQNGSYECLQNSGASVMEVQRTVDRWLGWNGCDLVAPNSVPVNVDGDATAVTVMNHSNCQPGIQVIHNYIAMGGHHWPQGAGVTDFCDGVDDPNDGFPDLPVDPGQGGLNSHGFQSDDISMQAILNFFANHIRGPNDDGDIADDLQDNCVMVQNDGQQDTDGDGFGNICDAELNNDCNVNFVDLGLFTAAFNPNPYNADADFNSDGAVNFLDLGLLRGMFFSGPNPGPGPSGVPNICD